MKKHLISREVFWLNMFPRKGGVSQSFGPRAIVYGTVPDFKVHCKVPFGAYCEVHDDVYGPPLNTDAPRTTGAIALSYAGNVQGGYHFMSLVSGKRLIRRSWTELPMPSHVVATIHKLADDESSPSSPAPGEQFTFRRRDKTLIKDTDLANDPLLTLQANGKANDALQIYESGDDDDTTDEFDVESNDEDDTSDDSHAETIQDADSDNTSIDRNQGAHNITDDDGTTFDEDTSDTIIVHDEDGDDDPVLELDEDGDEISPPHVDNEDSDDASDDVNDDSNDVDNPSGQSDDVDDSNGNDSTTDEQQDNQDATSHTYNLRQPRAPHFSSRYG